MNAYAPLSDAVLLNVAVGFIVILAIGTGLVRSRRLAAARTAAWLLAVTTAVASEWLTRAEAPGFRMLVIAAALLLALKAVVAVEARIAGHSRLRTLNWLMFAAGWPGMRPAAFASVRGAALGGAAQLFKLGTVRLLAGMVLILAAAYIARPMSAPLGDQARLGLATALLLPGLSLAVHFGLFNMLAGLWRFAGADCRPLFRAPLYSKSLAEFWGRRWNLAFSEMTALVVFRPVRRKAGDTAANLAAFLFSGVLHELAISVPVKAGFGLPLLYFAIHAFGTLCERGLQKRGWPLGTACRASRIWTAAWIVLPLPLLFHIPFLKGCVWPLIGY